MALGNRSVTDLPILTSIGGAWVYNATGGVDYRVAIGGLNGLAYTAGDGTLSPTIQVNWSQNINTPTTLGGYGITDAVSSTTSRSANTFLAAPNGTSGAPSFRTILPSDIPTLNQNTTGSSGSTTGNAATATKLQTARTINGVPFDGTANITLASTTSVAWGAISGTLSDQSDLNTALNSKPSTTGAGATGTWSISITGSAGSVAWTNVSGRPVNVSAFANDAGYITSVGTVTWGSITGKPTTKAGYGITDVPLYDGSGATGTWGINVTGSAGSANTANSANSANTVPFSGVSGKPTTLGGYGITDAVQNASGVASAQVLTQAAYNAIGSKDPNRLYIIVG